MTRTAAIAVLVCLLTGCRSHVISVTLVNASTQPVNTIVVDYPSATFGVNSLAPGKTFNYAIRPLDTGRLKIQFRNAKGEIIGYTGPELHLGDDGAIRLRLEQDRAVADLQVRTRRSRD